jgi:hypothetical protein
MERFIDITRIGWEYGEQGPITQSPVPDGAPDDVSKRGKEAGRSQFPDAGSQLPPRHLFGYNPSRPET